MNVKAACEKVCAFESQQLFTRGIGIDWSDRSTAEQYECEVSVILTETPPLNKLRWGTVVSVVRLHAALSHLLGVACGSKKIRECMGWTRIYHDQILQARMLCAYASHQKYRAQIRENENALSAAAEIEIIVIKDGNTTCNACLSEIGKTYTYEDMPILPHERCACDLGCRCRAILVIY